MYAPSGVAVDAVGNLYISDTRNERVRKVSNGIITTIAGNGTAGFSGDNGPAIAGELNSPRGIAVDSVGNVACCRHEQQSHPHVIALYRSGLQFCR